MSSGEYILVVSVLDLNEAGEEWSEASEKILCLFLLDKEPSTYFTPLVFCDEAFEFVAKLHVQLLFRKKH